MGPSFGDSELWTYSPLLGEGKVCSSVGGNGFMIEGTLGDINPLTGDTIIKFFNAHMSFSTAVEIEVW